MMVTDAATPTKLRRGAPKVLEPMVLSKGWIDFARRDVMAEMALFAKSVNPLFKRRLRHGERVAEGSGTLDPRLALAFNR
jgi:hypothetical protein